MNVVALHAQALRLMRDSQWKEAIAVLKSLLDQNPDYEHGAPWYDIACCHDELGEVAEARRSPARIKN
jgi:Flp pilus assembly protein TadD